jgi:hypothetical protein
MSNEPDYVTTDSDMDNRAGPTVASGYTTGAVAPRVTNVRHVDGVAPTALVTRIDSSRSFAPDAVVAAADPLDDRHRQLTARGVG